MKATIKDISLIKSIVDKNLNNIFIEIPIQATEEGLKIMDTDTAGTSMAVIEIPKTYFETYEIEKNEYIKFNGSLFTNVLKRCSGEINLETSENQFIISSNGKKFKIPLFVKEGEDKKMPVIEGTSKLVTSATNLMEALRDVSVLGLDAIKISLEKDNSKLIAEDQLKAIESDIEGEIEGESANAKFGVTLLEKLLNPNFENVTIELKTDSPITLHYEKDEISMKFLLAPRVE